MSVQGFNFGDGIVKYDYNHLDNAPIPEEMTVGSANQLISKLTETDKEPYLFRTAGGSLEIGDREKLKTVVGGSVGWNQLVQNGDFASSNKWTARFGTVSITDGIATVTVSADGTQRGLLGETNNTYPLVASHKYFIHADIYSPITGTAELGALGAYSKIVSVTANTWTPCGVIWECKPDIERNDGRVSVYITQSLTQGTTIKYKNVFVTDLTLLFGPTIADYLYALETATAGAGVAWFKKLFPKDYYAYDAGSIKSVDGVSSHDMVGFNQWNEEWELGKIRLDNGEKLEDSTAIRSKNYIAILPSVTYYFKNAGISTYNAMVVFWYDSDKNFIKYNYCGNITVTSPSNAHYALFYNGSGYGTTYNHDICINFHWDGERDGEYEEYSKHSYPLDSTLTLRGIPELDANNQLYYDGDTYEADGTVTRRYGIVDLGTLTWSRAQSGSIYRFQSGASLDVKPIANNGTIANMICSNYKVASWDGVTAVANDKTIGLLASGTILAVQDDSYTDATAFTTAMSGVYLVYELATSTTETADPYTETQIVDNWGTEEFVSTGIVPVGHETDYIPDLKAKLEVAPEAPNADGLYLMKRENGENSYVAYVPELPTDPAEDGTYTLKATKTSSGTALAWVADE